MTQPSAQIPLWRHLQATAGVVQAVREGRSGTAALEQVPAELRPGVQALAFQVWRNLGRAQALRGQLARKPPPATVDALLCSALALAWDATSAPYDAFTLVNQAVEAAKRHPAMRAQANFVNGCLRRFLREQSDLVRQSEQDPVAVWNHPLWWIKRVQRQHPTQWQDILRASNAQAAMTLRVNVRKVSVPDYLALLSEAGIGARLGMANSVVLDKALPVGQIPGFADGWVSVQDAAAQLAALLLARASAGEAPWRVLDACAAPGGKTGHLLEISDADVTALEIDAQRSLRIGQNLQRLQLEAKVLSADAADPSQWWDGRQFDAILLDAPCTASGIGRRHPDVRWLRRESDIAQLAALQRKMLHALWPLVRPDGVLLYCTCSIFMEEGQEQVQAFLAHNTGARLLTSPGHLFPESDANLPALPDNQSRDHDGFFYALLQKHST